MAYGDVDEYGNPLDPYGNPVGPNGAPAPPQPQAAPFDPSVGASTSGPGWTAWQPGYGPADAYNPDGSPKNTWDKPRNTGGAGGNAFSALWESTGKNPQAFVQALIQQQGLKGTQADPAALNAILSALKSVGVNAALDTRTDQYHKGLMIDGQFVKMLDGNDNWIWQGGAGAGAEGYGVDPSYLQPYTQQFQAPGDAALPQFQGPGAFKLPTKEEMMKDPGYLFRENRITDQVQNSASAAGTLNSSGTLDRIMGSIGDFAGQEYGNVVNRDLGIWNADWTHALDAFGANTGRANTAYGRAVSEYDRNKQQFYDSQDRPFDKLYKSANLGFMAASA